jgi:soluble lytic murein transglycosylase-like protein
MKIHDRRAVAFAAGLLLVSLAGSARADRIYKYVDEDGVTVISNVPRGGRSAPKARARRSAPFKPRRTDAYDAIIEEACLLYRIPVPLARAVMAAESNFDPAAVSHAGAMGLMQLMPATAAEMFVENAFDPKQNIHGGIRYLRVLANMFDGDMVRMVAAYNAGPAAVRRANGIPDIAETQEYVRRVLRLYFAFKNEGA